MNEWKRRISEELANLGSLFNSNELAYLALTQKVEHAVRDKLAFALHRKWSNGDSLLVCREWSQKGRRVDLAVVKDSSPLVLMEVKAQYTFDILKRGKPHDYPELLRRDLKKLASLRTADTQVFTLLLATHTDGAPDKRYRKVVKYFSGVAGGAHRGICLEQARDQILTRLPDHPQAATDEIKAGKAFGTQVSVAYWLFGPYPNVV